MTTVEVSAPSAQVKRVDVESVAMLAVLEQYQRRSDACPARLLGAILGKVSPVGDEGMTGASSSSIGAAKGGNRVIIKVSHCFPVPHSEVGDQISLNMDYFRTRMGLYRKCYSRDVTLLGWYSVKEVADLPKGAEDVSLFAQNGEFIRDAFARETGATGAPLALNLDITIRADEGLVDCTVYGMESIKARQSREGQEEKRSEPSQIPHRISFGVPEAYALDTIATMWAEGSDAIVSLPDGRMAVSLPDPIEEASLSRLEAAKKVEAIRGYVADVKSGKRKPVEGVSDEAIDEILAALGISKNDSSAAAASIKKAESIAAMSSAVKLLATQLDIVDQQLLSQSFTC